MSYPKRSGPFIHRPMIENRTSKKTSDLIGGTVNARNNKHGIVCLFVCLLEKSVSPSISICSHIAGHFKGEKNNKI